MAGQDLICAYLAQVRAVVGFRRDADAIVAELEDHLRSGVERRVRAGLDEVTAQKESLDVIGEAGEIARELCRSNGKGVALPSPLSRAGGVAALTAAALVLVSPVPLYAWVQVQVAGSSEVTAYWVYALVLVSASTASLIALAGTLARAGSGASPGTVAAMGMAAFGVVLTALFTWGSLATLALICLPFGLALALLARITPVPPWAWVQVAAWPVALGVFVALDEVIGLGPADEYGDHPWAWFVGGAVFAVLWAIGQFALGRRLLTERMVGTVAPTLVA
jgi:hypothetical protein